MRILLTPRWRHYITLGVAVFACAGGADDPLLREGLEAFRRRDFSVAERAFSEMARQRPSAHAWKLLGMTYIAQEKYNQAEEPCRRACQLDAREENGCYYLGRVYFTLSRLAESRKAYETALQNGGGARVELGLAMTLERLGEADAAERYFRNATMAGESEAGKEYGLFLFRHNRAAEAVAVLRKTGESAEAARVEAAMKNAPRASETAAAAPIRFEATELPMILLNSAAGDKHLIETMTGGVAIFDYDGDGWPDIYVVNGASIPSLKKTGASYHNRLYRNNHDGTFTDVTAKAGVAGEGYSMGVAAGDFDNDGHTDLFVTGVRSNTLYRNRGDGTFEDVTVRAGLDARREWSVGAGWFDYDGDGRLDLFVVRYVDWDVVSEPYCGDRTQGRRQYCHPSQYTPLANALYHNEGGGRFRDVSRESGIAAHKGKGMAVAFGDFDGDGRLDAFVTNDSMPNFLFRNRGGGTFEEVALAAGVAYNDDGKPLSFMGADFRDYDNDGRDDLLTTALTNETHPLFRNLGGRFIEMTYPSGIGKASFPWTGWSTGLFDFNNDGWKDIFTANGHVMDNAELTSGRKSRQPNLVFMNRGGRFDAEALPGEAFHRGAAFGDLYRDGCVDVVVTRLNERPLVLRNRCGGNWLELRLEGTRSNRDAIGARVHIVTAAGEQWNRVTTAVGYASSSDRVVHFGLGAAREVTRVEIEWPSGKRQALGPIAGNQILKVKEP
jgi:tetratricopeptide (TPR) repeat protein